MIAMFGTVFDVLIGTLFNTVKTVAKILLVMAIVATLLMILLITGASHLI